MNHLQLKLFDRPVLIVADDPVCMSAIRACYSSFVINNAGPGPALLELKIAQSGQQWSVAVGDQSVHCDDLADLVFTIEKNLTIELQLLRPDLYFLHAAALAVGDHCVVIAGSSGAGKSTLCWELCNAGFEYMSDELAPVNLETMDVEPYPHAICIKKAADGMTALPEHTLNTGPTMHIPTEQIPGGPVATRRKLKTMVFLHDSAKHSSPSLNPISTAEAAARIYANGLNQLAHDQDGLAGATKLAAEANCYLLARGEVCEMRDEVVSLINS